MPVNTEPPTTTILPSEMTGEQLARPDSERVTATTRHGSITGGQTLNGCQVFLNVPYGLDVPRWSDPQALPSSFRYQDKDYTKDGMYCAQPTRDYTLQIPVRERLGLGTPTENPFFADIYVPSSQDLASPTALLPVRVFLHGGFLQFGSTSGNHYNQQFFAAEHFGEIRVLLGHRVSVLGFLGASEPQVEGNYGFKDCWLGLDWVRDNIASFGGDPSQIHLSGLSGGGHIVHQLLHQAARLAPAPAPFVTALLQSNAIVSDPVHPSTKNDQFNLFCKILAVDPAGPDVMHTLRDRSKFSTEQIIQAVQSMGTFSTFRGVIGTDGWVRPDEMRFQQSGELAQGLKAAGVKCVIMGDVRDEDSFYQIVHPCQSRDDLLPNLERYYPPATAKAILASYPPLAANAGPETCDVLQGRILADGQVHLPVRLLANDLASHGFPVVRYAIEMVPKALGTKGKVTHGSDLPTQHLRLSMLSKEETSAALRFHATLQQSVTSALEDEQELRPREEEEMLILRQDGSTGWDKDWRWPQLRAVEKAIRG